VRAGEPARQRGWTLRRRIAEMAAAVAGLLAILVAAVVLSAIRFVQAGNAVVDRWDPAVSSTQRLLTDLVDEETGLRGYALSSAQSALQPYQQARRAEPAETARLRTLVAGDRQLRADLADMLAATGRWQTSIRRSGASRPARRPP
jgi:CHASE3 domain sensor protein